MATRDFGGAVIPWYEPVVVGSVNFVKQPMPANPPADEVQKYLANEAYVRSKRSEGNSGFGGFVDRYVNPILNPMADDPIKTAAMFAAAVYAPYLIPVIAGADTAIAGGSPEDVLKSAAIAYVTQAAGSEIAGATGAEGFTGATETGLPTLASETVGADVLGTTLLNEASSPTYDFSPEVPIQNVSPELDPTIFTPEPTPTYDFSPQVPVEQVSPELDPTSYENTFEPAPKYDFSPETPVENVSPELDTTGTLAESLNPTLKDLAKTLRTANTVKNVVKTLTPQEQQSQLLRNAQTTQQQSNLANMLRGTQMAQTMTPAIYKQKNPFNFGQQNQPVQDTNALANLLRTA
jgi:hypothetical protein